MRRTFRQLAAVKPSRYLEAGAPTGLTGLFTHPAPRSALIYLYTNTLEKLKQFPESSLYRQSSEAVVNHRLAIVQAVEPEGYKEWKEKAEQIIAENPEVFTTPAGGVPFNKGQHLKETVGGHTFITTKIEKEVDERLQEWDGEEEVVELEGTRTTEERKSQRTLTMERPGEDDKTINWSQEPPLTAEQIEAIENKIGGGLIEEVIQVAEGELKLVDVMLKSKVWEDLEEKPAEGQWTYFMRNESMPSTQQPPQK